MMISHAERLNDVGQYDFSRRQREIAELNRTGPEVISIAEGSPDLCPSPVTISQLTASAQYPNSHGYQSDRGSSELRAEITQWYRRIYDLDLDHRCQILPLLGSKEGIFHISMAYLNPGDEVLVPNPGNPAYSAVARLLGATPRYYDLHPGNGWQIDVEALEREDLSKVKMMWVNYPHMPTGARAFRRMFADLVKLARAHRFLIVNDNPYSVILNDDPLSMLNVSGAEDVALELGSLSKSHNMAGWRVGWVAGSSGYLDSVLQVKSNIDLGMFLPIQHAAIAALRNPDSWHQEQNLEYRRRSDVVLEICDLLECRCDPDQVGLFKWARIPDRVSDVNGFVDRILLGARVLLTPGTIFGSNGQRYIRLSLCADTDTLEIVRTRLGRWIATVLDEVDPVTLLAWPRTLWSARRGARSLRRRGTLAASK